MNVIQEKIKKMEGGGTANDEDDDDSKKTEDREIRVPYHRPRQFTFQEFMARKYINKPTDVKKGVTSRQAMINAKLHPEAFAMKMKLREEEALEFFRSSSESEEEVEKKVEEVSAAEPSTELVENVNEVVVNELVVESAVESTVDATEDQEMTTEPTIPEVAAVEKIIPAHIEPTADPVIFDDEEDVAEVEINEEIVPDTPAIITLPDKRPSLSLKPGEVLSFDMETGSTEVRPAKLTGVELFKKDFLDRLAKRTKKKGTDVKSQINDSISHQRPGEAREILLKSIIEPVHQEKIAVLKKQAVKAKLLQKEMAELEPEDKEEKNVEMEIDDDDPEYEVDEDEDCEEEEEPEENDVVIKDKKSKHSEFMDDEVSFTFNYNLF